MRTTWRTALVTARLVVRAATRRVTMTGVGTALALMLGLGGCTMSHGAVTDADGDGFGADVDCDDGDPSIYPGAHEEAQFPECCDGTAIDMDCDGMPPVCACNWLPDNDGDGYTLDVDCNDANPDIYPGAPEHDQFPECCDGTAVDMDCDGMPPICACNPIPDADGDGYLFGEDCDDADPDVHPGATEPSCPDGVDQDCDGIDGDPGVICNGMADVDPEECRVA